MAVGPLDPPGREHAEHGPQGVGDGEGLGGGRLPRSTLTRLRSGGRRVALDLGQPGPGLGPVVPGGGEPGPAGVDAQVGEQGGVGHPVQQGATARVAVVGDVHGGAAGRQGQEVARRTRSMRPEAGAVRARGPLERAVPATPEAVVELAGGIGHGGQLVAGPDDHERGQQARAGGRVGHAQPVGEVERDEPDAVPPRWMPGGNRWTGTGLMAPAAIGSAAAEYS